MNKMSRIMKILQIMDVIDTVELIDDFERDMISNVSNDICPDDEYLMEDIKIPQKPLRDMTNPIEMFSNEEFKQRYSFSKTTVLYILDLIVHGLERSTNRGKPVPPLIELLITLKFMTAGTFQSMIDDLHGVSQPTISRLILKVSSLLAEQRNIFIKYPSNADVQKISKNFYDNYKFPFIIGCLGSTHVGIKNPGGQISEAYLNEHGYYSLKVQVHHLMLQDKPRNEAYRKAIINNKDFIKGKTVLDVGAGTGILSVFCAQAGAEKVYAVEASNLYQIAQEVVKENKFENVIQVIHSKVEDLTLPDDTKVDIIVSEWMGFYLLHEGMLDSIIFAREKFLKEDGHIFPESATIYCAPCSVPLAYNFWDNISGVSMTCVGKHYRELKFQKPEVLELKPSDLLQEGTAICWLDLRDITEEEIDTIYNQTIVASSRSGDYQGLCLWFSCQFPALTDDAAVILSTSPNDPATHWKQTVVVLPAEIPVEEKSPIAYELFLRKSKEDRRRYNIEVTMLDPEEITHPEPCDCHLTKCIIIKKMIEQYESGEMATNEGDV